MMTDEEVTEAIAMTRRIMALFEDGKQRSNATVAAALSDAMAQWVSSVKGATPQQRRQMIERQAKITKGLVLEYAKASKLLEEDVAGHA